MKTITSIANKATAIHVSEGRDFVNNNLVQYNCHDHIKEYEDRGMNESDECD